MEHTRTMSYTWEFYLPAHEFNWMTRKRKYYSAHKLLSLQCDNDFACDWMVFATADHVTPARKYYCTCNKRCPINQKNATKHEKKL